MTPGDHDDIEPRLRPYVPELLLGWPADVPWQELEGTLVSADISGFTALSERLASLGKEGAETLNLLVSDCFHGMIEDCVGRGGDIIKFGGDALLVWFFGDHHAVRAVSAALAMRSTIRQVRRTPDGRRVPLGISIGAHSGAHHFVQVVGTVPDLIVTGPGATATVQAESDAEAGMVLVAPSTAALLPPSWLGSAHGGGVVVVRRRGVPADLSMWPSGQWARPPSAFVPPEQRDTVLAGIANEHRQLAVSFVAFGGADRLVAEGRIDELAVRLQQVTSSISAACARNSTYLLATDVAPDGGKFIVAGGAPIAHGNNEDRLLRTVREVVDADPGLDLHAGVHRGSLYAGDLGSARRRVYTTLGDSMNLAARLSAKAAPGEVVVSRVAMEWSSVEFEVDPLPPFLVKGKAQPIHAGRLGASVGRRRARLSVDGPMVGRVAELQRVLGAVDHAKGGTSAAAVVVGEPGSGTTRLLAEVVERATELGVAAWVARCSPLDRVQGHSVSGDLVRHLLGVPDHVPGDAVIERLAAVGAERFPRSVALLPLLAPVLDADVADTPESLLVPVDLRTARTAQLVVQVVSALVTEPTLLAIDDVHHADEITTAAVGLLCGASVDLPLCTVVTTKTPGEFEADTVELHALDDASMVTLVDRLLADADVSSEIEREIVARSDGNPLFATEIVGAVLEGSAGVPDTLDAAIEIRLDRLDPVDRRVLRTAAVLGAEVPLERLGRLLDAGELADHERWDRLAEFLERVGPGVVRFRLDAHRRVAYDGLPYRTRRQLHAAVMADLEADAGGEPDGDLLTLLAYHADAAGDEVKAWRFGAAAGRAAVDQGRPGDAARWYRLAWRWKRAAPSSELARVAEAAGDSFEVVGEFDLAVDAFGRALAATGSPIDRARLLRKRGDVAERAGEYAVARRWYQRAARQLRNVPWSTALREQAQLDCARSGLALRQSQSDEAWRYANLALAQAERVGDWSTAAHAALMVDNLITQMSWSGVRVSRPDVLGMHQRAGDLLGAARWLSNQAVDRYYEGFWDDAVEMYRESAEQCARFGHLASEATALNNIAEIHSDRGRYDEAAALFRTARRSWRAIGYGVGIALVQANLGRLATRTGRVDDGVDLLTESIGRFEALHMPSMTADVRLRLVEHALLHGLPVLKGWWPDDADVADDVVTEIYRDRLLALAAHLDGDVERAHGTIDAAVDAATAAALPFDRSLALRLRIAIGGHVDTDDASAVDDIHRRLGIVVPPPVVPNPFDS